MNLKNIFVFFLVLLIGGQLVAQKTKLKYKEVYETVLAKNKEATYPILMAHQRQDPFHVNTYYQLGGIAKFWAKEYDPFVDYKSVMNFIYDTKLYYGLGKSKLDEKEARKNRRFYQNLQISKDSTKIQYEDILKFTDDQLKDIEEYERNVKTITSNYNKSVAFYNDCILIFMSINKTESRFKDMLLTSNEELMNKLKKLSACYDSVQYYFSEYKTNIKNYPIKNYNQNLKSVPIETYRLDGLVSTNFLNDEIIIGDYSTWVKKTTELINSDILAIRTQVSLIDKEMNQKIETIRSGKGYTEMEGYKMDEKFMFKVGKYDQNSLALSLFLYKEAKSNFLARTKNPLNDPLNHSLDFSLLRRARYYNDVFTLKKQVDSLNKVLISEVNPKSVQKYNEFFKSQYGGTDGLKSYVSRDGKLLDEFLDSAWVHLKAFTLRDIGKHNDTTGLMFGKNDVVNLFPKYSDISSAADLRYVTLSSGRDKNGNYYLSGYYKPVGKPAQAFVAKTVKDQRIEWLKVFPAAANVTEVVPVISVADNSCLFLVTSFGENNAISNVMYIFDQAGRQTYKKEFAIPMIPRYLIFDDINENALVGYRGTSLNQFESTSGGMFVNMVYFNNETLNWSKDFVFEGNLVDILRMDKNYFVFTNYSQITTVTVTIEYSKAGTDKSKTNTMLTILDEKGQQVKVIRYESEKPVFLLKAVKLNSNLINLIGVKSDAVDLYKAPYSSFGSLFYGLVNLTGEQFYKN